MKVLRTATVCLFILMAAIIANSLFITHTTEKFAKMIEDVNIENFEETANTFENIFKQFRKAEKIISITVSHDDLTNIEESFADIIGAAKAGMKADIITIQSRLVDALHHLGRLSGINLDSII